MNNKMRFRQKLWCMLLVTALVLSMVIVPMELASANEGPVMTGVENTVTVSNFESDPNSGSVDQWDWRSPLPTNKNLMGSAWGNGIWVVVGDEGTVLTSTDRENWTRQNPNTAEEFLDVAFCNGKFFAITYDGIHSKILTSPDAITWTTIKSGESMQLQGIAYGNGMLVVIGNSSTILTSSDDGVTWVRQESGLSSTSLLVDVAYGNNTFVVVGTGGKAVKSTDGVNWSVQNTNTTLSLWGIAFGGGKFVAVGDNGVIAASSVDGTDLVYKNRDDSYHRLYSVEYVNGGFTAVGCVNVDYTYMAYSMRYNNGTDFTTQSSETIAALNSLAVDDNNNCVAVGSTGAIMTSAGGTNWTFITTGIRNSLGALVYGDGKFTAAGDKGSIQTSLDGITWTIRNSGTTKNLRAIAYGGGILVAVGDNGSIITSPDGETWTVRTSEDKTYRLNGVAYGGGVFVAVGNSATILTSPDGVTWTQREIPQFSPDLMSVAYGNDAFVAIGRYGQVVVSTNQGETWVQKLNIEPRYGLAIYPTCIIFAGDKFVVVGGYRRIWTSTDNNTWVDRNENPEFSDYLNSVAYANGRLLAVGQFGTLIASMDGGITWNELSSSKTIVKQNMDGVASNGSNFVVVGELGATIQSRGLGDFNVVPVWPAGSTVAASNITENTVELNWTPVANVGTIAGYRIYCNNTLLNTVGPEITSYSVTGLSPNINYVFKVEAGNNSNSWTANGPSVQVTTPMSDSQAVEAATAALSFDSIKGSNSSINDITSQLNLMTSGQHGTVISWESSESSAIGTEGTVTRPMAGGSNVTVTLTATIQKGETSNTLTFTLIVTALPAVPSIAITTTDLLAGTVGSSYSVTLQASGGTAPYTWSASGLPVGLSVSDSGVISGTTTSAGAFIVNVTVTGSDSLSISKTFTLTINSEPIIYSGGGVTQIYATVKAGTYIRYLLVSTDISKKSMAVSLDESIVNEVFGKVGASSDGVKKVIIEMPKDQGTYILKLPSDVLSSENAGKRIEVQSEAGTISFTDDMLKDSKITGDVGISFGKVDVSGLAQGTKDKIGSKPVVELKLTQDDKTILWGNPAAPVTVCIPYQPTEEELVNPEHITILYIDEAGDINPVPNARYDSKAEALTFKTTHFGKFAAGFVQKTFNDLGSVLWAKKQIEVLASKGILKGISENEYAPRTNITRADFLYFLVRTLGVDVSVNSNFGDVSSSAYYYKEIAIAKKLGITNGTGNNKFSPDTNITRQDMIVLAERALRMLNKIKQQGEASEVEKFTDKSLIAAYAINSVASLIKEGLIVGSGKQVNPLVNTTRAEAAVFLYRIYNKY